MQGHCPSSPDNVAVYADGHGHCFGCDWTGTYEAASIKLNGSSPNLTKNRNNYNYMLRLQKMRFQDH